MGWTSAILPKGLTRIEQAQRLEGLNPDCVVESGCVGNVLYTAERLKNGQVIGCVYLFERGRDGEVACKGMSEEMGPYQNNAPLRVLDALTPTDNATANNWREACRARAVAKAARPKLHAGMRVKTSRELKFTSFTLGAGTEGKIVRVGPERVVVDIGHYNVRIPRNAVEVLS
jgi:hypothetical protein